MSTSRVLGLLLAGAIWASLVMKLLGRKGSGLRKPVSSMSSTLCTEPGGAADDPNCRHPGNPVVCLSTAGAAACCAGSLATLLGGSAWCCCGCSCVSVTSCCGWVVVVVVWHGVRCCGCSSSCCACSLCICLSGLSSSLAAHHLQVDAGSRQGSGHT